jgi:hypothetical protein
LALQRQQTVVDTIAHCLSSQAQGLPRETSIKQINLHIAVVLELQ